MENVIDFYSKHAVQFDKKIGSLDLYNHTYTNFVNSATDKRNLLDLACGPGNVSAFIQNLVPNIDITCVDLSESMIDIAKSKLPNSKFYKSDILDITIPHHYYDLIICAFGLPYINKLDIRKFVSEIDRFAHNNSIVYVSCMQGDKTEIESMSFSQNDKVQVYYHQKNTITDNFLDFGYKLLSYAEQNYIEPNGTVTIDMIFNFKRQ